MNRLLAALVGMLALLTIAGVVAVIVWFANELLVSSLVTVTVLFWLAGWLVIVYGNGRLRAAAIGAVVAGAAYWLLALGPWFETNIGSTLLTSRLLIWVETTYKQPDPQQAANAVFTTLELDTGGYLTTHALIGGSGAVTTQPQYVITTIPQQPPPPAGLSNFQAAGHWSFAWLFALAGAVLAAVLQRRAVGHPADKSQAAS